MTKHTTGTREEWLAARVKLLEEEKELTHRDDEVAKNASNCPGFASRSPTIRDRRGPPPPWRTSLRALAAPDLPPHVRPRLHRGLPRLLVDLRRLRPRRPSGQPRRDVLCHLAGSAGEAPGLQAAHGLEASPGPPPAAATSTSTSTPALPRSSSARATWSTTTCGRAASPPTQNDIGADDKEPPGGA